MVPLTGNTVLGFHEWSRRHMFLLEDVVMNVQGVQNSDDVGNRPTLVGYRQRWSETDNVGR